MAELAQAHGIEVVIAAIPPSDRYFLYPQLQPVPLIRQLNTQLKAYAQSAGFGFIDYYQALSNEKLISLAICSSGSLAMWALLAVGLCNSIMFPTILSLALAG